MRRLALLLLLLSLCGSGCQTALGNYFGNRARDFGECFRLQGGVGLGLGADVKAAGVLHAGFIGGVAHPHKALGWRYGDLLYPHAGPPRTAHEVLLGGVHTPLTHKLTGRSFNPDSVLHMGEGSIAPTAGGGVHGCWWLLPSLFSTRDGHWLWAEPHPNDLADSTWARVHVFDVEATLWAGVFYVSAGFSPGEFLDFLLGWFGLDIAGDDVPWPPPEPDR